MKKHISKVKDRLSRSRADKSSEPGKTLPPRITNETVAEHREEVLSSARKYIYPLQHSRHRIIIITVSIFIAFVLAFMTYTLLALYRFHTTSTFMYRVTQVIPFPVARAGSSVVAYENYLFDLRRYMHYYETQQEVDFTSQAGQEQLAEFRKRALEGSINTAFVKQLASQNDVRVTRAEVDGQIELLRSQNRLGGSDQVFEDVLREFWDWSVDDFRRELSRQLLAQKVASSLDTETHEQANQVLAEIKAGKDFKELAKQYSDDVSTKDNGGEYGISIERSNRDIQPQVIKALFTLEEGETSNVIETATGLEIVKVLEKKPTSVRAAHILFVFEDINTYTDELRQEKTVWRFVRP